MGHIPQTGLISYCMSKAGLEMLTKASAVDLAPLGVRVNAVAPGVTDTNMFRYSGLSESEYLFFKKRAGQNNPMQRISTPEEVCKSVIFLTSEKYLIIN